MSIPGARCRATTLIGGRPLDLTLAPPPGALNGIEVAVELAAEANTARKTVLVHATGFR